MKSMTGEFESSEQNKINIRTYTRAFRKLRERDFCCLHCCDGTARLVKSNYNRLDGRNKKNSM
jgi:hypothetical protein